MTLTYTTRQVGKYCKIRFVGKNVKFKVHTDLLNNNISNQCLILFTASDLVVLCHIKCLETRVNIWGDGIIP